MGKCFNAQGHVTLKLCSQMELLQDFMPVLIICKFEEDPIKIKGAMVSTTFFLVLKGR